MLQPASRSKLLLRHIPTFSGDLITGFVDLALERAFVYKEHAPSEIIPLEGDTLDLEKFARFSMLETLADHDDELMEQLLEDIQPHATGSSTICPRRCARVWSVRSCSARPRAPTACCG